MPLCPAPQTEDKVAKYTLHGKDMDQAATFHGCFSESTNINNSKDKALFH